MEQVWAVLGRECALGKTESSAGYTTYQPQSFSQAT